MAQLQKYRVVNITGLIENMTPRWRKGAEAYKPTGQRELKFLMAVRCVEILKERLYMTLVAMPSSLRPRTQVYITVRELPPFMFIAVNRKQVGEGLGMLCPI
jgi:hypothetical protein